MRTIAQTQKRIGYVILEIDSSEAVVMSFARILDVEQEFPQTLATALDRGVSFWLI